MITLFTHHAHNLIFLGRNYTPAGDPRRLAVRVAKVRGAAVLPDVFELAYGPALPADGHAGPGAAAGR